MEREYVDSTDIRSMGYDSDSCVLEVEFNSGAIWQYPDFPEYLWFEFQSAPSKGKFFAANIKAQYTPTGYRVG